MGSLLFVSCCWAAVAAAPPAREGAAGRSAGLSPSVDELPLIVPHPRECRQREPFVLGRVLRVTSPKLAGPVRELLLAEIRTLFGVTSGGEDADSTIALVLSDDVALGAQGYLLEMSGRRVTISAGDVSGLFHGARSMLWLARSDATEKTREGWSMPGVMVRDWPDNPFRAVTLQLTWSDDARAIRDVLRAMAMLKLSSVFLEFGPNVRQGTRADPPRPAAFSREDLRGIAGVCRGLGLEPLPYLNSLGHAERSYAYPKLIGGKSIDLGADENYDFLFRMYDSLIEDFGGRPRYFHAGMDEAGDVLLANAAKYGRSTAQLLSTHITRVNEYFRERGIAMVIWHDLLLSKEQTDQGHANGGPPLDCWGAIRSIPRDVVLDYWQYSPFAEYPVVDSFLDQGFRVMVSPWKALDGCRTLTAWGTDRGCGLVQTAWSDPFYDRAKSRNNMLYLPGVAGGLVVAAEAGWNKASPPYTELGYYPYGLWSRILSERRTRTAPRGLRHVPIQSGGVEQAEGSRESEGMPRGPVVLQGISFDVAFPFFETPSVAVMPLPPAPVMPLTVVAGDQRIEIDGVNAPRGTGQLILYTPAFGSSTRTNIHGAELRVIGDAAVACRRYGEGDALIPRNGYVLSAHQWRNGKSLLLYGVRPGQEVRILDAGGNRLLAPVGRPGALPTVTVAVDRKAGRLYFLWALRFPLETRKAKVGDVVLRYADGERHTHAVSCPEDITPVGEPMPLAGPRDVAWTGWMGRRCDRQLSVAVVTNPHVGRTIASVEIQPTAAGRRAGILLTALTLGP